MPRPRLSSLDLCGRSFAGTIGAAGVRVNRTKCGGNRMVKPKAPVAQWIEQRFPKPRAQVRFLPGASVAVTIGRTNSANVRRLGPLELRGAARAPAARAGC